MEEYVMTSGMYLMLKWHAHSWDSPMVQKCNILSVFINDLSHSDSQPLKDLRISSSEIFLDNVQCAGHETSLLNCRRNAIGEHNCGPLDGAGVRCVGICSCETCKMS